MQGAVFRPTGSMRMFSAGTSGSWRISSADELSGIDLAEHSEAGYDLSPVYYTNKVQRTLVLTKDDMPVAETTGAKK